ncbi:hypothetical protein Ga0123462_2182 [Mariprofundus ferrinatatus]|uniref:Outer membrane protein assembly factor BamC n=1 Tax=Mariprofundus ferrinatatus TaxID=1921087 RepID=A0A2K8LFG9_9PROT|nr:hypothetical protein [Mariprofundus ferrinatatus]ATX83016.1 hypothetical protein Ga0123462_2182 [Mariprofundus ferrinatatus]
MMNPMRIALIASLALALSACGGMPKLFWEADGGQGAQQDSDLQGEASHAQTAASPESRSGYVMPVAGVVGSKAGAMPEAYKGMLAGRAVTLDARTFNAQPGRVLSSVVDAMFSLNIPVDVVDSPNGIITSDWVREGENDPTFQPSIIGFTRHSFVVRVVAESEGSSMLEVHTIGQEYVSSQWEDRPLKRKVSEELFSAVDELLKR